MKSSKLINMHDFDQLVPLISPNAIFWFNDGSFCGLKQIRQAFEETWKKFPLENYWLENLEWVAQSKDCAGCTYHFRWRAILNGSALEGGGRGTTILRREANVWKITHEHLSQFPKQDPKGRQLPSRSLGLRQKRS
ncbi:MULTISPECIES: YybH family protein [Gammaproteobacteria]|uniref:Nuclear transport factor 2 family protein n=1 Tax=Escherichia coli TaxID=562 RepID=A0AAI9H4G0_ECOLX|nr:MULTISPECIES: nuclear transport factor 2 family protein [Gammaproteobacteria]EHJ4666087.1 nuclear transport factor 2 family protein [Salmonella enterica subsp. enterica serovar 4,[5],12:i:-]EID9487229.1 nuclear transport factor 2 family protein [Salmonella enterica subsp. enterica serovar Muenster]EIX1692104.1 nuclear transport factor 2 family protein [Salmonella enterica subsp. enterica serovar Braenderup]EIY2679529.1 nuclear transport factor 2 family protein [Raoultella planticola]EIZ4342